MGNSQCFKGTNYNTQIISHKVVVTRGVQCNIPYCTQTCCLNMILSQQKNESNFSKTNNFEGIENKKVDALSSLQNLASNNRLTKSKTEKPKTNAEDDLNSISETLSHSSIQRSMETKTTINALCDSNNFSKSGKIDQDGYLSGDKTISVSTKESSPNKNNRKYQLRYTNKSKSKVEDSGDSCDNKDSQHQKNKKLATQSKPHKRSKNSRCHTNHSTQNDRDNNKSHSSTTDGQYENAFTKRLSRSQKFKDNSLCKQGKINKRIRGRSKKKRFLSGKLDLPPVPVPQCKTIKIKKRYVENLSPKAKIPSMTKDITPLSINSSVNNEKYSPLPTRPSLVAIFNSPPQISKKPSATYSTVSKYPNFTDANYLPTYHENYSALPSLKTSPIPRNHSVSLKPPNRELSTPSPTVTELLADLGKAEEFYYQSIGLNKEVSSNQKDSFPEKFLSRIDESRQSHEFKDGFGSDIVLTKISSDNEQQKAKEIEFKEEKIPAAQTKESNSLLQNQEILQNPDEKLNDNSLDDKGVKFKFYLKDNTHLEHILSDPSDRRIRAICDKYQCDLEVFSKTPKNGFLQYSILMKAPSFDVLRTCARALDSSLKWCISAQLK